MHLLNRLKVEARERELQLIEVRFRYIGTSFYKILLNNFGLPSDSLQTTDTSAVCYKICTWVLLLLTLPSLYITLSHSQ